MPEKSQRDPHIRPKHENKMLYTCKITTFTSVQVFLEPNHDVTYKNRTT